MIASVRQTQKKYGSRAMVLAITAGMILILMGQKPIGKGLVLGALFSVINFVLMGETLPAALGQSRKRAYMASLGSISFRYALLAIPLFLAIRLSQINLLSTVVGLFLIQVLILADHCCRHLSESGRNR